MTASSTGRAGREAPALFRCTTRRHPGVSARARATSSDKRAPFSSVWCLLALFAVRCEHGVSCHHRTCSPREGAGMPQRVRGVVSRSKGAPVEVVAVVVPDPGPGEALVRVQACGVCHTDLHYREGAIADAFPFLLGQEAVGPDVTGLVPGDFVVLAWRAPCGQCRSCTRGRPWYCFDSRNAGQKVTLEDGTELSAALGIGAFAEACLVAAGQAVKVDPAARPEAAGLVGCGIMAGFGAALNTGGVRRGDTVAVFGCGGVGDAAIHAAALVGARRIIAVDVDERKLKWAREFGATDTIDATQA